MGEIHWIAASTALIAAAAVFLSRKGTSRHRKLGWTYVMALLMVNISALAVYDISGGWGPFHWLALLSLATLGAGMMPAVRKRSGRRLTGWLGYHSHLMAWSAIGLACAGISQLAVQLWPGWPVVAAATGLTMLAGHRIIQRTLPASARRAAGTTGETVPRAPRP
jgi:uncharacterized membrane protein